MNILPNKAAPPWFTLAAAEIGVREVAGAGTNAVIAGYWKSARLSGIKDDAVPWCSGFACAMLERAGFKSPRADGANSFLSWGVLLQKPMLGCIAVFRRPGGAHVGFVAGVYDGGVYLLAGNQGDAVSIARMPLLDASGKPLLTGYRMPVGYDRALWVAAPMGGVIGEIAAVKSME